MDEVIINSITWSLIIIIVGGLSRTALATFDAIRSKNVPEDLKKGVYTIKHEPKLIAFIVFGTIIFGYLFGTSYANYFYGIDWGKGVSLGVVIFFGIVLVFFFLLLLDLCIWRISVNGDSIKYRNMLGFTKEYTFDEIDHAIEKMSGEVIVYGEKGKLFTVQELAPKGCYFSESLRKRNIPVKIKIRKMHTTIYT